MTPPFASGDRVEVTEFHGGSIEQEPWHERFKCPVRGFVDDTEWCQEDDNWLIYVVVDGHPGFGVTYPERARLISAPEHLAELNDAPPA